MTKPNTPTTDDPTTTEEPLRSHRPGIEKDGAPVSYAKKNLRDVKDSAAEHGLSAHQAARFPGEALGCEQTGMNFLVVKPRQREAFAHRFEAGPSGLPVLIFGPRVESDAEVVQDFWSYSSGEQSSP